MSTFKSSGRKRDLLVAYEEESLNILQINFPLKFRKLSK